MLDRITFYNCLFESNTSVLKIRQSRETGRGKITEEKQKRFFSSVEKRRPSKYDTVIELIRLIAKVLLLGKIVISTNNIKREKREKKENCAPCVCRPHTRKMARASR